MPFRCIQLLPIQFTHSTRKRTTTKEKTKEEPMGRKKKSSLTVDEKGRKTGFKKSYKERKKEIHFKISKKC